MNFGRGAEQGRRHHRFFPGPGAFILEVGLWDLFATLAFPAKWQSALKGLEALGDCKRGWGPENSGSGPFVSTWPSVVAFLGRGQDHLRFVFPPQRPNQSCS